MKGRAHVKESKHRFKEPHGCEEERYHLGLENGLS